MDDPENDGQRAGEAAGELGSHGMPRLPPDQYATKKWPVLDLGSRPRVTPENWTLDLLGACARPMQLDWSGFMALEQVDDVSDFHCVTGWSRFDIGWRGVRFVELAALAGPLEGVGFVMCHGHDGYSTNLPLAEAMRSDVLLAHTVDGKPLPVEHGGPVRMVTPRLYAWKGAKWIRAIEFMIEDRPGYWEERGYSDTADPWRNDRYR